MSYKIVAKQPSILWSDINEINDRIDAKYYHCDYMVFNIKNYGEFEIKSLKQCVNFFETGVSNFNDGNIKLKRLKTSNIQNGFILYQDLTDCVVPERDKKKILCKGDVVLTTYGTGSIGKVAYVNFDTQIIPDYTIAILRTKKTIDSGYLASFLGSIYGKQQIMRRVIGTSGITLVIKPHLIDIQIPIPSPEIQKYIGDKVRKAEELREEAKRLKIEAEEILNKELNLKDVEFYIKQTNNKKYSWTESIEIEDRIDSEFYKPKYRYLSKLNNMSELSYYYKISKKRINKNIDRKIKYIDLSSVNNIIEPSDFNTKELPSRAQFLVKEGNLIISTLKGSNKISIIPEHLNDSVCSTGFIVIASKSHLTTEYLYLVFSNKVFNMQIERYSTGSIMSGVNHDNFNKMLIPVISNKQIIDTITNKIRKHFRLLYYSKQLIQEAKQDVEDLIEGNFDMSKVKANN
jgi:restriction endonuclease S subunit